MSTEEQRQEVQIKFHDMLFEFAEANGLQLGIATSKWEDEDTEDEHLSFSGGCHFGESYTPTKEEMEIAWEKVRNGEEDQF